MAEENQTPNAEQIQPDNIGDTVNLLIDGYKTKTGLFSEGQPYFEKSAYQIAEEFKNEMAKKGGVNGEGKKMFPRGTAIMEAFQLIDQQENPPSILDQLAGTTVDQFHGLATAARDHQQGLIDVAEGAAKSYIQMHGNMFPFNLLRRGGIKIDELGVRYQKIDKDTHNPIDEELAEELYPHSNVNITDEKVQYMKMWDVQKPKTTAGQVVQGVGQAGLSVVIGDKIVKPARYLSKAIPALKHYINTPGFKALVNAGAGEALTLQGRDRFSTLLRDTFGVESSSVINYLAEAEDENAFEARFKSLLDGMFGVGGMGTAGVGLSKAFTPILIPIGKAFRKAGFFFSKVKDPAGAQAELDKAMSHLQKIEQLYPEKIVKTKQSSDPLVQIKTKGEKVAQESVEEVVEEQTEEVAAGATKPKEVLTKKGKKGKPIQKPAPIQPDDIKRSDLDIYKNRKDVPLDSTLADFNMERIDTEDSIAEVIQRGAEILNEKLVNSKYYGPSGKAVKQKGKDGKWTTEGDNVITHEDVVESAEAAEELLKRNGISKERLFAGLKTTTEELPHLVLMARDYVVDMARKVRDEARVLDEKGGAVSDDELARFHRTMVRYMNNLAEVKGIKRDIARTLSAMNIDAVGGKEREALVDAIITDAGSGSLADTFFSLGKARARDGRTNLLALVQHTANMEYADEMLSIVNKDRITRIFDLINYVGINSYLANFSTQTVNLIGSLAMTNILTAEKFIAAGYGAGERFVQRGLGQTPQIGATFDEATAHTFGAYQALSEIFFFDKAIFDRSALGQARRGFMDLNSGFTGYDIGASNKAAPQKWMGMNVPEGASSESIEQIVGMDKGTMPEFMKEMINGLGVTLGVPGRMLMGGDRFFRAINYRSAIHALTMRKALQEGLTGRELQERYIDLIRNLPEEIDHAAQTYAQVALFQEDISKEGIESMFKAIEKARNSPLPDAERSLVHSLISNGFASFVNQKIPFMRTPYNIFKQSVMNRGIGAIVKFVDMGPLYSGKAYRKQFKTDAAFRQDVLAKITTGGILQGLGYTLGRGVIFRDTDNNPDTFMQITGGSDPSPQGRDIAQDQMRMQPEILIRNMATADAVTIPIGRADPVASLVQIGSIVGNMVAYYDNHIKPYKDKNMLDKAEEQQDLMIGRIKFQLGNFFLDKAMLRGLKDTINDIPGLSPQADPQRLLTEYFTKYMTPVSPPLGNLGRGTVKAFTNTRVYDESRVRGTLVDRDPKNVNISDSGLIAGYKNISPQKAQELEIVEKVIRQIITEWRKVNIIDMEEGQPDVKGMVEGRVAMKRGAIPMVDLEGNVLGFTDKEKDLYNRWLDQNLIPFTAKRVNETNTSVLINELDIKTGEKGIIDHPKRWTHMVVKGRPIPLTSEQQMVWAALYGFENRKIFSQYDKEVKILKLSGAKGLMKKYGTQRVVALRFLLSDALEKNKEISKQKMINKFSNPGQKSGLRLLENQLKVRGS